MPFTRKIIFNAVLKSKKKYNQNKQGNTIDGEIIDKKDEL